MPNLGYEEAFAVYGAKLKNKFWSVCAEGADGSLVVSLWEHHFGKVVDGVITCRRSFNEWSGAGNNEFREKVKQAFETQRPIRVVIAKTHDLVGFEAGKDAPKSFCVRPDWLGRVVEADEEFSIEFKRESL